MPTIFQPRIAKKINKALSVRVIVICSGHKLLWRDSYKGVGCTSTSPESVLHKIIIIIIITSMSKQSEERELKISLLVKFS